MASSTSFRISDSAKRALNDRAQREGSSATALLERLILEGVAQADHPGIVFRGPEKNRRAAVAGGADVWEIVSRLQELQGSEEQRITTLTEEAELHPREIRVALSYAAEHADEIADRTRRNHDAAERSRQAARQREALLA